MSLTTNTSTPAGGKLCGTCGALLSPITRTIATDQADDVVKVVGYICPTDPSHQP